MEHQKAADLFTAYVDGQLGPTERTELERHLSACIQCRTDLESFRRTLENLNRLKQMAPPTFLPAIQRQIFLRSQGRFFGKRGRLFGRLPFEWVSLVTIVAMLAYYVWLLHGHPTGVRPAP